MRATDPRRAQERRDPGRLGQEPPGLRLAATGVGAAVLVIVCCAGPALVAAGALGALGGLLSNRWVIATAALVVIVAVMTVLVRRRSGRDACRPPTGSPQQPADKEGPERR